MNVGTVVTLKMSMLGEEQHAIGVVFYEYDGGAQIIFERGGYDGYSDDEQKDFLIVKGVDEKTSDYKFKNVMQVSRDYDAGMWRHVFENKKYRPHDRF